MIIIKNQESKVSIVIPVFNAEKYIEETIYSVINQSHKNIEIIIINDGSTDNSLEVINNIYDDRIRVFDQKNKGVSSARNLGITKSKSDYIMFLDSDDVLELTIIDKFIKHTSQFDFILCGYEKHNLTKNSNSIIKYECKDFSGEIKDFFINIEPYIKNSIIQSSSFRLFSLEIIKRYNLYFREDWSYGEDTLFTFEYLRYSKNVKCINEELYFYKIRNESSLSNIFFKEKINVLFELNMVLKDLFEYYNVENNTLIDEINFSNFNMYLSEILSYKETGVSNKEVIKNLLSRKELIESISNLKYRDVKHYIMYILIKLKSVNIIIYIYIKKLRKKNRL